MAGSLGAALDDYASGKTEAGPDRLCNTLAAGARVRLSLPELLALAQREAPPGVRNPHIQLATQGMVSGSALVDFGKLRRAQGYPPGKLASLLLDGERPVSVTANIESSRGWSTVTVRRVGSTSGIEIDGGTLDFLIRNIVYPLYPDALVDQPFEMAHHRLGSRSHGRGRVHRPLVPTGSLISTKGTPLPSRTRSRISAPFLSNSTRTGLPA